MSDEVLIPILASILTLILTKTFDSVMANRKGKLDAVVQSLVAVDEITSAASDTISYLKAERDAARKECERHKIESEAKSFIIQRLEERIIALETAMDTPFTNE